jgi:hypothetical protein
MSTHSSPSSRENTVQPKPIALIGDMSKAYPIAVQAEVARQLSGFDELPKFSQEVARRVLSRLPESVRDNE